MSESRRVLRRRQFCTRCGQLMFEYHSSPDGHFGLVGELPVERAGSEREVRCPTCGTRYRLLDRVDPTGRPVVKA